MQANHFLKILARPWFFFQYGKDGRIHIGVI